MNISKALKRVRLEKNMRQGVVAKKAKISQTYLSQLENGGKKEPSSILVKRLCKIYDVPPVLVAWYAMEESDVKASKKKMYLRFKPLMDELTSEFLKP